MLLDYYSCGKARPNMGAFLKVRRNALLWSPHSTGTTCNDLIVCIGVKLNVKLPLQIGIINHPDARLLERPINAIIAGSAPTAHLIGELEKKNIHVVHVYGLT